MKIQFDSEGYRRQAVEVSGSLSIDWYQYDYMPHADCTFYISTYNDEIGMDIDVEKAKLIVKTLQEAFNLE